MLKPEFFQLKRFWAKLFVIRSFKLKDHLRNISKQALVVLKKYSQSLR